MSNKLHFYTEVKRLHMNIEQFTGRVREYPDLKYVTNNTSRDAALSGIKRLVKKLQASGKLLGMGVPFTEGPSARPQVYARKRSR